MKAQSKHEPLVYEVIDNSRAIYRLRIEEKTNDEDETLYEYDEVMLHQPVSKDKITESVIAMFYPPSEENKLINNYNAAKLNFYDATTNEKYIREYEEFLQERQAIKEQIRVDCQTFNI